MSIIGKGVGINTKISGNYYSGIYATPYAAPKPKVLVLAGNRNSFDIFLALGVGIDKKKYDYVFVEKEGDFTRSAIVKILDDFCLNPNIVEILNKMNDGDRLFFNGKV